MIYLTTLYGSLGQGLLLALVAIGIFINMRIMKKPDLTVEGSFAFGGVLAMTMLAGGAHFIIVLFIAPLGGVLAGLVTGLITTKLKVDGIIAGLLVTMALFSVNMFVMDGNIINAPLETFIFTPIRTGLVNSGMELIDAFLLSYIIVAAIILAIVVTSLWLLFKTQFGLSVRATGSNEYMARSNGINTDARKIFALMLSNGIIALAGALIVQQRGGAEVNIGVGIFVIGLAGLVIGEALTPKKANILVKLLFVALGSFIYFTVESFIILWGIMDSSGTQFLTAVLALLALVAPRLKEISFQKRRQKK